MKEVAQLIVDMRDVGNNIASIAQDIGLLLGSDKDDDANIITRVKHSKILVENIISVLTMLSLPEFHVFDRHKELSDEVRKIEFSCAGLQSILSQSLIDNSIFKTHKTKVKNFILAINMASNKVVTISLVTKYRNNNSHNNDKPQNTETNCFGDDTVGEACCEDMSKQNELYTQYTSRDEHNSLINEQDVCFKTRAACEKSCNGICSQYVSDTSSDSEFSNTNTKNTDFCVDSEYTKQEHYINFKTASDIRCDNHKQFLDARVYDITLDSTEILNKDNRGVTNEVYSAGEVDVDIINDTNGGSNVIETQESIPNKPNVIESDHSFGQSNRYDNINEGDRPNTFKQYLDSLFVVKPECVDTLDTERSTLSKYKVSTNEDSPIDFTGSLKNDANSDTWKSDDLDSYLKQFLESPQKYDLSVDESDTKTVNLEDSTMVTPVSDSLEYSYEPSNVSYYDTSNEANTDNYEITTETSHIKDDEDVTTTETSVTDNFQFTYESSTVSYYDTSYETTTENIEITNEYSYGTTTENIEITTEYFYETTTENIEITTEYSYETTTEFTTPTYETTTEDLYKVSQDIYSAAQDLSTKANEISSITSDISSKVSSINSMVSDLNNYDDDELSKKIQSVSKITQEISSKTSEISSLCSTTSSLASDISSASSDMPSADRHHRFRTSPWRKMSDKSQDMVTACQSIVTVAQDILLSLDGLVTHTETLKVADAVSTGVYDVTAKTQLVISETLNILSAVIELMNAIES